MKDAMPYQAIDKKLCLWCFQADETVHHHPDSDTYWHKECLAQAGEEYVGQQSPVNKKLANLGLAG
ncbi:hypothetical protein [Pseudogemmobacter sp. W21_MBD1_M6]|uniref:hypothetical protein n=1 Tax=Pseudogemmobacter sp. W21_MBD1_M6 TaxID=3240271 RepID=UPI003F9B1B11